MNFIVSFDVMAAKTKQSFINSFDARFHHTSYLNLFPCIHPFFNPINLAAEEHFPIPILSYKFVQFRLLTSVETSDM